MIFTYNNAYLKIDYFAMDGQVLKDIASFGNKVVPTTWMAKLSRWSSPSSVPRMTTSPAPMPEFLMDFLTVLTSNKCNCLFGIDTIAERAWTEIKIGDASVVVPSDDRKGYNQEKFIPVAFAFDKEKSKFQVHGRCAKDHRHMNGRPKPPPPPLK
ncbi:hypothetical protein BDZ97DRAFT_1664500 [Flammula alnicola]|nr:hypothetical protein BDZ97DRAFT_1664500 [Flammula alnicola]